MTPLNPDSWLKSYGDYLFSYCMLRVNHRETAEDLVQETLISAFRARDTFRGDSTESTWLVTILKNKIIDHYRKKDVMKDAEEYLASTDSDFSKHFFSDEGGHWLRDAVPQVWDAAADSGLEQSEFNEVLQACVHKMPAKLAPVFIAKFFDDEDSETICKVHNITPSNYWVIIHRAKLLMRACLEKRWFLK